MAEYDGLRFHPPAPLALVTVRRPGDGAEVAAVPMLIDSGADVTLIPRHVADALALDRSAQPYVLAGFDGQRAEAVAVQATLVFDRKTYRGQFLVIDQEYGILGRNRG